MFRRRPIPPVQQPPADLHLWGWSASEPVRQRWGAETRAQLLERRHGEAVALRDLEADAHAARLTALGSQAALSRARVSLAQVRHHEQRMLAALAEDARQAWGAASPALDAPTIPIPTARPRPMPSGEVIVLGMPRVPSRDSEDAAEDAAEDVGTQEPPVPPVPPLSVLRPPAAGCDCRDVPVERLTRASGRQGHDALRCEARRLSVVQNLPVARQRREIKARRRERGETTDQRQARRKRDTDTGAAA